MNKAYTKYLKKCFPFGDLHELNGTWKYLNGKLSIPHFSYRVEESRGDKTLCFNIKKEKDTLIFPAGLPLSMLHDSNRFLFNNKKNITEIKCIIGLNKERRGRTDFKTAAGIFNSCETLVRRLISFYDNEIGYYIAPGVILDKNLNTLFLTVIKEKITPLSGEAYEVSAKKVVYFARSIWEKKNVIQKALVSIFNFLVEEPEYEVIVCDEIKECIQKIEIPQPPVTTADVENFNLECKEVLKGSFNNSFFYLAGDSEVHLEVL